MSMDYVKVKMEQENVGENLGCHHTWLVVVCAIHWLNFNWLSYWRGIYEGFGGFLWNWQKEILGKLYLMFWDETRIDGGREVWPMFGFWISGEEKINV